MIDTHAHIYLREFDKDRDQIITNARVAGIDKILLPAIDSNTHDLMLEVERNFGECIPMIGLHPCSVKKNYDRELEIVKDYLQERPFIAVGEIGLDLHWDVSFINQQYDAFHKQIEMAIQHNIPIVIHSRNAIKECIEVVKQYPDARGVFHCFSGTEQEARQITAMQFMLGIGGVVTFKNAGLDKVIEEIGITSIILETDAPYLAPVPYRGKRNEPAYTRIIAEKISNITGQSVKEIEELTTANAIRLFNLK